MGRERRNRIGRLAEPARRARRTIRAVLYGRDTERARIGALLEDARASRSGALVIWGEPGIGKTALIEDTKERAVDMHVLSARGVESEAELPFAALHQLLRPALAYIDQLPPPQANALRAALGLIDGASHERFLVFAACLSLLSELAERRPVLCLVDDAQWLDAASADAVRFVARRLDAEGIVILFGVREGLEGSFDAPDLPWLRLSGLDPDAAGTLLAQGAGVDASHHVRDLILEQTGGNALALLEVPSVLTRSQLAGDEPLPETLPLTERVERVFLARVRRLPDDVQRLLLIAAVDDTERVSVVRRAAGVDLSAPAGPLDAAEAAGLLSIHGTRLEFRHPLVRSAVYGAATSTDRRAAHRALADALADDDEQLDRQAWHLAAAVVEPDADVLSRLDGAAERAQKRGAYGVAVRAFERAAELSADDDSRARRLFGAASCASIASTDEQATSLAERALPLVSDRVRRAELSRLLALAEIRRGQPLVAAHGLLHAAQDISAEAPSAALELLLDGAWAANEGADRPVLVEICAAARDLGPTVDDERAAFIAAILTGLGTIAEGDAVAAVPFLEQAVAAGELSDDLRQISWSGSAALWLGDERRAGVLFERGVALARARGALGILAPTLGSLGLYHFFAQRFDQAVLAGREAVDFAREVGAENMAALPLFVVAAVAAIRGEDEVATRLAGEVLERAAANGLTLAAARPVWALALLDLGRGRWADAQARLETLVPDRVAMASGLVMHTYPDRIEAAVRAGDPEAARAALLEVDRWAGARAAAVSLQRRVSACRALLADGDEATRLFEEALRDPVATRPFDLARIQLLYGEHLRRDNRRSDSRVQLRAALEAFDRLRAEPWSGRAQSELRASGETARKRDPSTSAHLTPQETQIARLVGEGLSNKEVAAQLFLSPRTIDAHLRNIFSKLAITSRTQLARLSFSEDAAEAVPA
jgi:DNA-binding CsgD family transcriptional regulator